VICMPTDPKAPVDLLMYMERHFSILPQEINGRSTCHRAKAEGRVAVLPPVCATVEEWIAKYGHA
jgi:hypothetical protein